MELTADMRKISNLNALGIQCRIGLETNEDFNEPMITLSIC